MMILNVVGVLLLSAAAMCQQYQGNQVDSDYDEPSPTVRSFVRPAPTQLSLRQGVAAPAPTPIPILKQINRHNEDGSYTYGYEGADGSFKIETKLPTGEVMGKYGYVDDSGKVRVVEYGANKFGFQPSGEGITVAPPTLVDETTDKEGRQLVDYDDGSFIEQAPIKVRKPARVQRPQQLQRVIAASPAPTRQQYVESHFAPQEQHIPRAIPAQPAPVRQQYVEPEYVQHIQHQPQQYVAPRAGPVRSHSPSPVPQRVQIPGAVQVGAPIRTQQPSAPRTHPQYTLAIPSPKPVQTFSPQPQHQHQHQQQYQPTPSYHQPQARSQGLLDQLAKDYALPQNAGQPLHDISFGFY